MSSSLSESPDPVPPVLIAAGGEVVAPALVFTNRKIPTSCLHAPVFLCARIQSATISLPVKLEAPESICASVLFAHFQPTDFAEPLPPPSSESRPFVCGCSVPRVGLRSLPMLRLGRKAHNGLLHACKMGCGTLPGTSSSEERHETMRASRRYDR